MALLLEEDCAFCDAEELAAYYGHNYLRLSLYQSIGQAAFSRFSGFFQIFFFFGEFCRKQGEKVEKKIQK